MGNYRLQLMPMSIYDIPNLEAWLEAQAAEGWFSEWTTGTLSLLRRGTPQHCRFLMEPCSREMLEPEEKMRELYSEHGWEYVERIAGQFFLFRSTRNDATDMHTDPRIQALSLERITASIDRYNKRRRILWTIYGLLLVFALFSAGLPSQFDAQPAKPWADAIWLLIDVFDPLFLFLLFALLLCNYDWARTTKRLKNYQQQLSHGYIQKEPLERGYRLRNLIMLLCAVIGIPWVIYSRRYDGIALEELTRPHVTLQQLETEAVVSSHTLFGDSPFHEDENRAEVHHSLLAPLYYTTTEDVLSAADVAANDYRGFSPVKEEGLCYSPNLDAAYYQLLFPGMARATAESLLNRMRLVNLVWEYEEVDVPDTDFVILAEPDDPVYQMVVLAKGNKIAVFLYGGEQRLRDHLDFLATFVQ